jgi:hypothetical protein
MPLTHPRRGGARKVDPSEAARLAHAARERAVAKFLGDRHLQQYANLFEQLA